MSKLVNGKKLRHSVDVGVISDDEPHCKQLTHREVLLGLGYAMGRTIGQGTYSKVCVASACIDQIVQKVACKIINRKYIGNEFAQKFLPRELRIIRHLQHRNIITVFNILEVQETIYIFMEYCRYGDLLEFIKDNGVLNEDMARTFFSQIVCAVEYLHGLEVAHRDLKCENILLSSNNSIKLADFGFARGCVDDNNSLVLSETYCGSAAYAAPEIIQGIPYDPKMYDIWALGCILYIMITATMPFDDGNVKKMLKHQLNRSACLSVFKTWRNHCIHLRNLIAYLLEPEVNRRATIAQVADCRWLQDPKDVELSEANLF